MLEVVFRSEARAECACGRLSCSSVPPVVRFGDEWVGPVSASVTVYGGAPPLLRHGPGLTLSRVVPRGSGEGYDAVLASVLAASVLLS